MGLDQSADGYAKALKPVHWVGGSAELAAKASAVGKKSGLAIGDAETGDGIRATEWSMRGIRVIV